VATFKKIILFDDQFIIPYTLKSLNGNRNLCYTFIQGDFKVEAFLSPANRASKNKVLYRLTLF